MARLRVVAIGLRDELLAAANRTLEPVFVRFATVIDDAQAHAALVAHRRLIADLTAGREVRVPATYLASALFRLGVPRDTVDEIELSGARYVVRPDGGFAPE